MRNMDSLWELACLPLGRSTMIPCWNLSSLDIGLCQAAFSWHCFCLWIVVAPAVCFLPDQESRWHLFQHQQPVVTPDGTLPRGPLNLEPILGKGMKREILRNKLRNKLHPYLLFQWNLQVQHLPPGEALPVIVDSSESGGPVVLLDVWK